MAGIRAGTALSAAAGTRGRAGGLPRRARTTGTRARHGRRRRRPGGQHPIARCAPVRWLGVALLIAALGFGFQQWQALQQVQEFEELDLHLLASDLPIDAYLDRGFQNWLRTTFDH